MQAMGLRTMVYTGAHFRCAQKFQGHEREALAKSEQLERQVGRYLAEYGVLLQTQEEQLAVFKALGRKSGPTPDFLILSALFINGLRVRWIEVKHYYEAGSVRGSKWTIKIQDQLAKYEAAFGPDCAVVLK